MLCWIIFFRRSPEDTVQRYRADVSEQDPGARVRHDCRFILRRSGRPW
jgi:hypothetical protein